MQHKNIEKQPLISDRIESLSKTEKQTGALSEKIRNRSQKDVNQEILAYEKKGLSPRLTVETKKYYAINPNATPEDLAWITARNYTIKDIRKIA